MPKVLVICDVDYPGEWDVQGVALTPEAALAGLMLYWQEAYEEDMRNPQYYNWRLVPVREAAGFDLPQIECTDLRDNQTRRWWLRKFEVWNG